MLIRWEMKKLNLKETNKKIEEKVVNSYQAIEDTVVNTYTNIENKFVDKFLRQENETIEDAKKRLKGENI